jgi:hypothetical protein
MSVDFGGSQSRLLQHGAFKTLAAWMRGISKWRGELGGTGAGQKARDVSADVLVQAASVFRNLAASPEVTIMHQNRQMPMQKRRHSHLQARRPAISLPHAYAAAIQRFKITCFLTRPIMKRRNPPPLLPLSQRLCFHCISEGCGRFRAGQGDSG